MSRYSKKTNFYIVKDSEQESFTGTEEPSEEVFLTFEEALNKYLDSLYSFALRLTEHRERAEDLVQETSLRAFRKFHQVKSRTKVKTWLYAILMNTFRNKYRKEKKKPPVVDIDLDEALGFSTQNSSILETPEKEILKGILDIEIKTVLDELNIEQREVLWLSDVEGFSYGEISEIIDCPIGTIASRLYRARMFLRERLRQYAKKKGFI